MKRESVRLPRRRQAFLAAFAPTRAAPDISGRRTLTLTLPRWRGREGWGYRSGSPAAGVVLLLALTLSAALMPGPALALDLFARHQVSVEFATADGKKLAGAEVRVFAPGKPDIPVLTGRTDKDGKFEFPADEDGFWTAEARAGGEVARVTVRVGRPGQRSEFVSPLWLIGGLLLGLAVAFGVRVALARRRRQAK